MVSLIQPASPLAGNAHYHRHQPERTLLYQLVERHYPTFCALMAKTERPLPDFVQQEFESYGRYSARSTVPPVGAERTVPAAFPVCQ